MRKIPNILSVIKILLSFLLFFVNAPFSLFLGIYISIGCTDILDGFLARLLHVESNLGAKLDSLGDAIFYIVCISKIFFQLPIKIPYVIQMLLVVVIFLKCLAVLITKWKFNEWASMHTIGNKLIGLLTYVAIPVCIYMQKIPFIPAAILVVFVFLFIFEEILLLFSSPTYDINRKSIFNK